MPFCLSKRTRRDFLIGFSVLPMIALLSFVACGGPEQAIEEALHKHVLFFSNFEKGPDALDCEGDPLATFDTANTQHLKEGGQTNGYLNFSPQAGPLSYSANKNFPYSANQAWSGTVSFWLNVNSANFEDNYPEPFHIGKKDDSGYPWDDAVIFVDIKKADNTLRFGCYPNKTQEITDQMVSDRVITAPMPWKNGEWHHVAIAWSNFNSQKSNAEWTLFIDGLEVGRKGPLRQDVTWNIQDLSFRFNHYKFPGKIDEIAVFDKKLSIEEVKYLVNPKKKLSDLFYKKAERR